MSDYHYAIELHPGKWGKEFVYEGAAAHPFYPLQLRVNLAADQIDKQQIQNALTGLRDYIAGRPKWPPAP